MPALRIIHIFFILYIKNSVSAAGLEDLIKGYYGDFIDAVSNIPEDGKLNFTESANKYGLECQEHDVITEDGYILKLFHLIGNKANPILIVHGIAESSDCFILRGEKSLAITLAKAGHDVWAANVRGNKYSKRHVSLNPKTDREFWNFTFHTVGIYDMPALIDYVLKQTNQKKINTLGHSQGTTVHFVLGSMKPEYNDKINVFIALAPVCFMNNVLPQAELIEDLLKSLPTYSNGFTEFFYQQEILADNSTLVNLLKVVCTQGQPGYEFCTNLLFFPLFGADPEGLDPEFFRVMMGRYPTSTSIKSLVHYIQVIRRERFAQFDYGVLKNLKLYESKKPTAYDVSKINMKIALLVGKNDKVATVPDVQMLKGNLTDVIKYHEMSRPKYNHLDFLYDDSGPDELFPLILDILKNNPLV